MNLNPALNEGLLHAGTNFNLKCRGKIVNQDRVIQIVFYPEDGGSTFLRNLNELLPDHTVSHRSREQSSVTAVTS
jgi:hypothetical protein